MNLFLLFLLVSAVPVTGEVFKLTAADYVNCDLTLMVESCYDACASRHCNDKTVKEHIVQWTMDGRSVSSPAFKQVYWDCPVLLTTKEYGYRCHGEHSWAPGWMAEAIAEVEAKAKVKAKVDAMDLAESLGWKRPWECLPPS